MSLRQRMVASVVDVRTRTQRLVALNRELLAAEAKERGGKFGVAAALFAGAGLLALYALGFLLATAAVALALVLPLWLALLIVTVALFLIVAILIAVGRSLVQEAKKGTQDAAGAEAKATAELIASNVRETAAGVRTGVRGGRSSDAGPGAGAAGA